MIKTFIITLSLLAGQLALAGGVYMEPDAFIRQAFDDHPPATKVLWLDKTLKAEIETILQHKYNGFRVRYWREGERSAWVLDEIGKNKPITTGIVIDKGRIEQIRVLVFRESRGWEVRHDFFTKQFEQIELTQEDELSSNIDNISGATLSVRAITKQARVALLLHRTVMQQQE